MHRSSIRTIAAIAAVTSAAAVTGCSAPASTQAGFAAPVQTLSLGIADPMGRYSSTLAQEFARRVEAATSGAVHIEVTPAQLEGRRWNQALAGMAQEGDVGLALVPAQAWDALGVRSLTALYVPFLVSDDALLDAIATDDLATDLLAGLDGSGVEPLALLPGGMRHLFAEESAPVALADVEGIGARVAHSEAVWAMLTAAGVRPDDPNGSEVDRAVETGEIALFDATFEIADSLLNAPAGAADIVTSPHVFTLVANDDAFGGMSAELQEAMRRAAHETALWAAEHRPSDADAARALCERNPAARVVIAGEDEVQRWRAVTDEVAAALRSDAEVDALAVRIEALRDSRGSSAAPPAECGGTAVEADEAEAEPQPNVPDAFPPGTYRREVAAPSLVERGVNMADALNHDGTWELRFGADGTFSDGPGCVGSTYAIEASRVVITMGPEDGGCGSVAGQVLFSSGWRLSGVDMTFTDATSGHGSDVLIAALFGSSPWTKIE